VEMMLRGGGGRSQLFPRPLAPLEKLSRYLRATALHQNCCVLFEHDHWIAGPDHRHKNAPKLRELTTDFALFEPNAHYEVSNKLRTATRLEFTDGKRVIVDEENSDVVTEFENSKS
jgi:hypothetical protein